MEPKNPSNHDYRCIIGTYTDNSQSQGIYQLRFNPGSRILEADLAWEIGNNPSFLAYDARRSRLYSALEFSGNQDGEIAVFNLAGEEFPRTLGYVGATASGGESPCHLMCDASRNRVVAANYGSGTVALFDVGDGPRISRVQVVQHQGCSVNKQRQQGPHVHSITSDLDGSRLVVCDLGLDKIFVYAWNSDNRLEPHPVSQASVPPGSGPRHFVFHPSGSRGFAVNELGSTMTAFQYDCLSGRLQTGETVSVLPEDFRGANTAADIHTDSRGDRLYISNRGHDSIALFKNITQRPTLIGHIPSGGKTPRNFALTPDDRYLFAANQESNSITVFELTSELPQTPLAEVEIPAPVCILFL